MATENKIQHIETLNEYHILFKDEEVSYKPTKDEFYETILGFKELPTKKSNYYKVVSDLKKNGVRLKNDNPFSREWLVIKTFNPVLDRIVIDVDSDDLEESLQTTRNILEDLKDFSTYANVYFSGSKGFHIEINTEPLDIIDTTTNRAGSACLQFKYFLNYFKDKYPEVDHRISDGTRLFRKHHSVHKKTGNYKVLISAKANLKEILNYSKSDKDMFNKKKPIMPAKIAMEVLATYSKPEETTQYSDNKKTHEVSVDSYSVNGLMSKLTEIAKYNKEDRHDFINILGFCCTGYLNKQQVEAIAMEIDSCTDSAYAYESCINAYQNNTHPEMSLGALYNKLELGLVWGTHPINGDYENENAWETEKKARFKLFNEFKKFLHDTRVKNNYLAFKQVLKDKDNDLPRIFREFLLDYIYNDEPLAVSVILSLMTGLGLAGSIQKVNSLAGTGKTEFKKAVFRLIPNGKDMGKPTPAVVYRLPSEYYNRKVLYTNDKGLEQGQQKQTAEEVRAIIRELITDKKIKRLLAETHGKGYLEYEVNVDSVSMFVTELFTIDDGDRMGRQMARVTVQLDINTPTVQEVVKMDFNMQHPENKKAVKEFCQMHTDYMEYLINYVDIEAIIPLEVLLELTSTSTDITEAKRKEALYRTFCIYFDKDPSKMETIHDFNQFFSIIKPIGKYEMLLLKHLKKYMTPYNTDVELVDNSLAALNSVATTGGVEYEKFRVKKIKKDENGYVNKYGNEMYFITVNDAKSYLSIFRKGHKLEGYKDNAGDFLYTLEKKGFLDCIHTEGDLRLYYIPKEAK